MSLTPADAPSAASPVAGPRILATLADLALGLGWLALVGGGLAILTGLGPALPPLWLNVGGGAAIVLPVIGLLAWTEGGRYAASPGKQWQRLRVQRAGGGYLGRGRALLRNVIKIGLPWVLGHAAVVALVTAPSPGLDAWLLAGIAVMLPVSCLVMLWVDSGRTPADLVADSRVVMATAGRRLATRSEAPQ